MLSFPAIFNIFVAGLYLYKRHEYLGTP